MSKLVMAMLFLIGLALTVSSQQKVSAIQQGDVLLTKNKPTVYLSFERAGERKPIHASESNQGIWLRLHNNTKWAINFCTLSLYVGPKITPFRLADGRGALGLREGVEVDMCHGVEELSRYEKVLTPESEPQMEESTEGSRPQVGYNKGDMFSSAWLPAGHSVIFSVPREHLAKDLAVYIRFNYDWEYGERTFRSDEPEHRVYFRASDLPESIMSGKNKGGRQR